MSRKPGATVWTADLDMALRKAWAGPLKAADIAKQLGVPSKCSVIGRASRLGLPPRRQGRFRRYPGWRGHNRSPEAPP